MSFDVATGRRFSPKNKSFWLAQLCESNYLKLRELIPNLENLRENVVAAAYGKPALHLTLIERSPYTLTFELSHCFTRTPEPLLEPRMRIRVYVDSKCAEVLSGYLPKTVDSDVNPRDPSAMLDYKWALNYFLERWLGHCLRSRYRFRSRPTRQEYPAWA